MTVTGRISLNRAYKPLSRVPGKRSSQCSTEIALETRKSQSYRHHGSLFASFFFSVSKFCWLLFRKDTPSTQLCPLCSPPEAGPDPDVQPAPEAGPDPDASAKGFEFQEQVDEEPLHSCQETQHIYVISTDYQTPPTHLCNRTLLSAKCWNKNLKNTKSIKGHSNFSTTMRKQSRHFHSSFVGEHLQLKGNLLTMNFNDF